MRTKYVHKMDKFNLGVYDSNKTYYSPNQIRQLLIKVNYNDSSLILDAIPIISCVHRPE